jgi:uncharacterized protein
MNPLLRAIIDNDNEPLKNQLFIDQWKHVPDKFGYTPLEIAGYLGKYDIAKLLGGKLPNVFHLKQPGKKNPVELSLNEFEKALGFQYRFFLTFPSYYFFTKILKQCPYIPRSSSIATDNHKWMQLYRQELLEGKTAPIYIKWINQNIGYGAFAAEDIARGQFIGEYTGVVRQIYRDHPDHNTYCLHYPTKLWSLKHFAVDAMHEGNLIRFINHSELPNLQPLFLLDRRLFHQVFVANRAIVKGEQLTYNYGENYWVNRKQIRRMSL